MAVVTGWDRLDMAVWNLQIGWIAWIGRMEMRCAVLMQEATSCTKSWCLSNGSVPNVLTGVDVGAGDHHGSTCSNDWQQGLAGLGTRTWGRRISESRGR